MLALLKQSSARLLVFPPFLKRLSCLVLVGALLASCGHEPTKSGRALSNGFEISMSGNYLAGRYARRDNDSRMASINFKLARLKDPNDIRLIREAFLSELRLGNIEEAAKLAEHSIKLDAVSPFMMLVIGLREAKSGNWEKANDAFGKLPQSQLNQILGPLILGWTSIATGKLDLGLTSFSKISEKEGFEILGLLHLGLGYQIAGDVQKADAAFEKALLHDTVPPDRLKISAAAHYARSARPAKARKMVRRLTQNDVDATVLNTILEEKNTLLYKEVFIDDASDGLAEALFDISQALKNDLTGELAIIFARLSLYMRPEFAPADILLGETLNQSGKHQQAIAHFSKIRAKSAYFLFAQFNLATTLQNIEKTEDAVSLLENIIKNNPKDYRPYIHIGDLKRSLKKWDEAIKAYSRALQLKTGTEHSDWILYYSRGIAYEQSKNWDQAEADFLKGSGIIPQSTFCNELSGLRMG
jgi:tetratricopeptide (TPR) repeat protein